MKPYLLSEERKTLLGGLQTSQKALVLPVLAKEKDLKVEGRRGCRNIFWSFLHNLRWKEERLVGKFRAGTSNFRARDKQQ